MRQFKLTGLVRPTSTQRCNVPPNEYISHQQTKHMLSIPRHQFRVCVRCQNCRISACMMIACARVGGHAKAARHTDTHTYDDVRNHTLTDCAVRLNAPSMHRYVWAVSPALCRLSHIECTGATSGFSDEQLSLRMFITLRVSIPEYRKPKGVPYLVTWLCLSVQVWTKVYLPYSGWSSETLVS